ncbi:hypothetical protein HZH68_016458 [Vespula germanica]|uniref:Retrovirus-related Pol polyprotein from transposon TNT 1-94 n=1 Tax=Vespula germanica TaxID=30212 RepID=A0A834J1S3_VESGE|nr:hypothetical protein HZH68_016458 [Vespula germanica]
MNSVCIEMLSEDNYDIWKTQMEALLIKNERWEYVSGEKRKPELDTSSKAAQEEWSTADRKAKADLILSISPSVLEHIGGCETARDVWLKLESIDTSKGPMRKTSLLKQLTLHRMKDDDDIRDYMSKFFDTVSKLEAMNVGINKDLLAIMLLYSLPESYENIKCAIELSDELPNLDTLKVKILEESDARTQGNKSKLRGTTPARRAQWKPKKQKADKDKKESHEQNKFNVKCCRCRKMGHRVSECGMKADKDKNEEDESINILDSFI